MSTTKSYPISSTLQRISSRLAWLLVLLAVPSHLAGAAELRVTTENDLLSDRRSADDLYTFSLGLEARRGAWTLALRENAFTDRDAGLRFDETHLSLRRPLPAAGGWRGEVAGGLVRVGHGLFGESTQNHVHRLIGGEPVELRYVDGGLRARLAVIAERPFAPTPGFEVAPGVEIDLVPGLRSHALLAVRAAWRPQPAFELQAMLGARFADADFAPLAAHLSRVGGAARLGIALDRRYLLHWSYNDHGDRRQHLTLGYRLAG